MSWADGTHYPVRKTSTKALSIQYNDALSAAVDKRGIAKNLQYLHTYVSDIDSIHDAWLSSPPRVKRLEGLLNRLDGTRCVEPVDG